MREGAGTLPYENAERLETAAAEAARNFKTMCLELAVGGTDAYIYYRLLSDMAHPSIRLVGAWVDARHGSDGPTTSLRVTLEQPSVESLAGLAIYSLIWSGAAFDYLLVGRPRRQELETFAGRAGINAMLRIRTEVVQQRFARQKSAKERARRKRRGLE